jgi:hypothetical protein
VQESYSISEEARLFGQVPPPRAGHQGRGYLELRRAQNAAWAQDSVRKGVQHASDRNYALAIKCYLTAINLVSHLPAILINSHLPAIRINLSPACHAHQRMSG